MMVERRRTGRRKTYQQEGQSSVRSNLKKKFRRKSSVKLLKRMTCASMFKPAALYAVACEVINTVFIYYIIAEIFLMRAGLHTEVLPVVTGIYH
jgi:hypothetical protein